MKTFSKHEIERRLRATGAPPPPAELLRRLREEIPDPFPVSEHPVEEAPIHRERRVSRRTYRWLAASLALAALGGLLGLETWRQRDGRVRQEQVAATEPGPTGRVIEMAPRSPVGAESQPSKGPLGGVAGANEADGRGSGEKTETEPPKPAPISPRRLPPPKDAPPPARSAMPPEARTAPLPVSPGVSADRQPSQDPSAASAPTASSLAPHTATVESEQRRSGLPAPGEPRLESGELGLDVAPSTGGTAEPNGALVGDMFFRSYGVNPFVDTEDDPVSTFALDVDTGSYRLARSYVEGGELPPVEAVRLEEFVNSFDYGDPPPATGDFALGVEGMPAPFAEGPRYQLLRVHLRARQVDATERSPVVLIFAVDLSGSMGREDRLGLVRASLSLLLDHLRADDRVGLVVYGSRGEVLLEPTDDHRAIRRAIGRLRPAGSTNAEEGLVLAYELARRHDPEGAVRRVILCSDGVANVGGTGPESILERIAAAAEAGISLTTIGFGMGNYNDVLMEQLADRGDGQYLYIDTLAEARRQLVGNLTGMLQTVAADAKIQVEFDPATVSRYRLLGYENRDVADERFRDDTVDAGEIGAGHRVTALYEIKLQPGVAGQARSEEQRSEDPRLEGRHVAPPRPERPRLGEVRLRYQSLAEGRVVETVTPILASSLAPRWEEATPALRLAAVVASLAEVLRGSYWARGIDPELLFVRAQEVAAEFPGNLEVAELAAFAGRVARLARERPGEIQPE